MTGASNTTNGSATQWIRQAVDAATPHQSSAVLPGVSFVIAGLLVMVVIVVLVLFGYFHSANGSGKADQTAGPAASSESYARFLIDNNLSLISQDGPIRRRPPPRSMSDGERGVDVFLIASSVVGCDRRSTPRSATRLLGRDLEVLDADRCDCAVRSRHAASLTDPRSPLDVPARGRQ